MDRRTAKEYFHIRAWLDRAAEIVRAGQEAYEANELLQEAGDSLMMKLGEAATRLSRLGIAAPDGIEWADAIGNRNWLIHQYDMIDRDITWATLEQDLPAWSTALASAFDEAGRILDADPSDSTNADSQPAQDGVSAE